MASQSYFRILGIWTYFVSHSIMEGNKRKVSHSIWFGDFWSIVKHSFLFSCLYCVISKAGRAHILLKPNPLKLLFINWGHGSTMCKGTNMLQVMVCLQKKHKDYYAIVLSSIWNEAPTLFWGSMQSYEILRFIVIYLLYLFCWI